MQNWSQSPFFWFFKSLSRQSSAHILEEDVPVAMGNVWISKSERVAVDEATCSVTVVVGRGCTIEEVWFFGVLVLFLS